MIDMHEKTHEVSRSIYLFERQSADLRPLCNLFLSSMRSKLPPKLRKGPWRRRSLKSRCVLLDCLFSLYDHL